MLDQVSHEIEKNILTRKEILFLPIGAREWKGFEKTYCQYSKQEKESDIYIVPLPLLTKDPLGQVAVSEELIREGLGIEQYPAGIIYTDWQSYDISQHCPDIIYIQNPYDAENPYLTVPPQYYASNIRKYSEKLVFIPFKDTGEFDEKDGPDIYNLKHYAAAPGVICSDVVIVQSENIKQHYINAIVKYAGEDTKNAWEQKIVVREKSYLGKSCAADKVSTTAKKRILYCIGANELTEHKEELIKAITGRFEIFHQNKEKIDTTVFLYPSDKQLWREVATEQSNNLFSIIEREANNGLKYIEIIPMDADIAAEEYDAYYGSSSPLVPAFVIQKKPVMLADYGVRV